eukprot:PhF_6_TR42415/c0_g1_i1/m.63973/K22073/IBA57; transferase CAF17, mitochondrial
MVSLKALQKSFQKKSMPTESNLDLLEGISFEKGCYLGQELTSRSHFVGVTRKRILPLRNVKFSSPDTPLANIALRDPNTMKSNGTLLGVSGESMRGVALVRDVASLLEKSPSDQRRKQVELTVTRVEKDDVGDQDVVGTAEVFVPEWWNERLPS